ncbi:hypothetical protein EXN32_21900 [Agrobacterium tumefaciens]|uniref:hypothetical protein n=1 Tax=Agrobacterium TaxID=357 RepID=UPI00115C6CEC|nr:MULTISPECIES: hypothetical protein [Agrobacterium]MDA5241132.1 hypothetical protein [Agrobacterium sp. MAFF310724]MDA5249577.1 hypothetical protein [Agrobacterium sp. MAFF210268]TRB12360.1 hypothetical protein EXN32_21900 [Agrobacterium tumefaciens]
MIRRVDTAEDAIETYGRFREKILRVIDIANDGTTENEILKLLDNREAVMWVNNGSIAVVQIVINLEDDTHWCLIRIASGDLSDILSGQSIVEDWAKTHGAIGMCLLGRKGWTRVLEPLGFSINTTKQQESRVYLLTRFFDGIIPENDHTDDPD